MKRPQFTVRSLLVAMLIVAVVAGVISWLSPQTQFDLAMLVLVIACCFGMFFTGVLAIAVVQLSLKALVWLMAVVAAFCAGIERERHRTLVYYLKQDLKSLWRR